MGRAFEYRRARKEKRWSQMAKTFTKIGREIAMAVKAGGPDPETNPRLRQAIQNAKGANMPKDNVESAIKRASDKQDGDFTELVYEGYATHGVAVMVETATDNPTRTVANVRMHFNKTGGSLGTSGSVEFMFNRKGVFRIKPDGLDQEELELELIDFGLEEIIDYEDEWEILTDYTDFGNMSKALEEKGIEVINGSLQRIPTVFKKLTEEEEEEVMKLIDRLEDDDDVQAVYHNME